MMSALANVNKTTLPFAGRTQSLLITQTPKISPHTNLSPQNSVNGKVTPAESFNHLSVEQRNIINRSPSPLAPVRVSPIMINDSRRQSHTSGISSCESHRDIVPPRSPASHTESEPWENDHKKYKPTQQEVKTKQGIYIYRDVPQEDSDYEREQTPPTPPPRKLSRKGASLRLACIGKQQSDENPLMKKIAEPLKLAQTQAMAVAGLTRDGQQRPNSKMVLPPNRSSYLNKGRHLDSPRQHLHRASDSAAIQDSSGIYSRTNDTGPLVIPNYIVAAHRQRQASQLPHIKTSAESLVEKVLAEEGLNRYVNAQTLQQEIAEANDMTADEMDKAAHMLLHPGEAPPSPYYEQHLGGYSAQELKDYNCYSADLQRKVYSQSSEEPSDDEMRFRITRHAHSFRY